MDEEEEGGRQCVFYGSLCVEMMRGRPSRHVRPSALLNVLHMALIFRVPCWNVFQNWVKETTNIKKTIWILLLTVTLMQRKGVCVCPRYVSLSEQFVCVCRVCRLVIMRLG